MPQDKESIVRSLKQEAPTVFVINGINDAPALLEANLGVAIGAGTNVASESADLVSIEKDPLDVARSLTLGKATYSNCGQQDTTLLPFLWLRDLLIYFVKRVCRINVSSQLEVIVYPEYFSLVWSDGVGQICEIFCVMG